MTMTGNVSLGTSVNSTAGAASSGTPAASPAGEQNGFGKVLVQVMGGDSAATQGTVIPTVNVMAMLAALMGQSGDAADNSQGANGVDLNKLLTMMDKLTQDQDGLSKLLQQEDMQDWLQQALQLLQGMGMIAPADPVFQQAQIPAQAEQGAVHPTASAAAFSMEQAQQIIQTLVQASQEHPDNLLIGQLQEKFADLLKGALLPKTDASAQGSQRTAEANADESLNESHVSSSSSVQPNSAADHSALPLKRLNGSQSVQPAAASTNSPIHMMNAMGTSAVTANPMRLQMMAARVQGMIAASTDSTASTEKSQAAKNALAEETPNALGSLLQAEPAVVTNGKPSAPEATINSRSFVEEMSRFLNSKMRVTTMGGMTEARISLAPDSIGHVDVRLTMQNGQLVAHFTAQTAMGKELLESQMSQLRMNLQSQGVQVERMEVTQQNSSFQSGMFQDQQRQQSSGQNNRQGRSGMDEAGEISGTDDFLTELSGTRENQVRVPNAEGFDASA